MTAMSDLVIMAMLRLTVLMIQLSPNAVKIVDQVLITQRASVPLCHKDKMHRG